MANIRTRQTPSGPRYDVKFKVNGKHKTKTFPSEDAAKRYKKKVEGDDLAGLVIDPKGGETIFGPYADDWIEKRPVKGEPLSPMTKQGYKALMRRHITPEFGGTKLRQITPSRVRKWNEALIANKSKDQAAKAYRLLRAILMTAVADELIARNPCVLKGAGSEDPAERPMIETDVLIKLAEAMDPRLSALVYVMGFCTMRTGEMRGLQRRDIDLLHGTIRIERQNQDPPIGLRENTKTKAGRRTNSVPPFLVQILSDHLDAYVGREPDSFLFTRKSGLPVRGQDLSHAWKDACIAVGIWDSDPRPRLYDLRHHAGTISDRDPNLTDKEKMRRMGHSSPRAALMYRHVNEKRDQEHADYLESVMAAAKSAPESAPVPLRP